MINTRNALRKVTFMLAAIGAVLALGAGIAPASAATIIPGGVAPAAPTRTAQAAYSCSPGYFCIYTGFNGTGHRCQWRQRSVRATTTNCSWSGRSNVRSVRNRTSHRVQYYKQDNFNDRAGSTAAGVRGNLEGNYKIRSFQPQ